MPVVATDHDGRVLRLAREHAREAGVSTDVHIQKRELMDLTSSRKYGCVVCNPPWGHRMSDVQQLQALTRVMKSVLEPLETRSVYVLTALRDFERQFGRPADRKRKLYNGRIECTFYQYNGPRPPRPNDSGPVDDDDGAATAESDSHAAGTEQAQDESETQLPADQD